MSANLEALIAFFTKQDSIATPETIKENEWREMISTLFVNSISFLNLNNP